MVAGKCTPRDCVVRCGACGESALCLSSAAIKRLLCCVLRRMRRNACGGCGVIPSCHGYVARCAACRKIRVRVPSCREPPSCNHGVMRCGACRGICAPSVFCDGAITRLVALRASPLCHSCRSPDLIFLPLRGRRFAPSLSIPISSLSRWSQKPTPNSTSEWGQQGHRSSECPEVR